MIREFEQVLKKLCTYCGKSALRENSMHLKGYQKKHVWEDVLLHFPAGHWESFYFLLPFYFFIIFPSNTLLLLTSRYVISHGPCE